MTKMTRKCLPLETALIIRAIGFRLARPGLVKLGFLRVLRLLLLLNALRVALLVKELGAFRLSTLTSIIMRAHSS